MFNQCFNTVHSGNEKNDEHVPWVSFSANNLLTADDPFNDPFNLSQFTPQTVSAQFRL